MTKANRSEVARINDYLVGHSEVFFYILETGEIAELVYSKRYIIMGDLGLHNVQKLKYSQVRPALITEIREFLEKREWLKELERYHE